MIKKEIADRVKLILAQVKQGDEHDASIVFKEFAKELYKEKLYSEVIQSFQKISAIANDKTFFYPFELAYSFVECKDEKSAEIVYSHICVNEPNNTAVLNNLSNIKKRSRKYKEAFELISRAYQIEPTDEIISNNYENICQIISEQREKEQKFKSALSFLQKENEFVLNKLKLFIYNSRKDNDYKNGVLPIAKWKFKVFMGTDEQKADSLREQWLNKNYIIQTGQRGEHYEIIYEINPYLEKAISNIKTKIINDNWLKGIEKSNTQTLDEINYYRNMQKIERLAKEFRGIVKRDYDELTLNFLVKNNKSTIILAGSIIETLLIYYLKKRKIMNFTYVINNKHITKELYEATLNDLLQYIEQSKELEKQYVHLGNISRIFRNYVHPGKELRETEGLDDSKANLCYISASELINNIL